MGSHARFPRTALVVFLVVATLAGVGCTDDPDGRSVTASFTYETDLDTTGRTVCTVTAVRFTDTSTGGPDSWLWDFSDGQTSTEQNPIYTPQAGSPSELTVTLEVERDGSADTATETIVFPLC